MSSQQQNTENSGGNASVNAKSIMGFPLASLATTPLGPTYNPLAEWEANVSRRDNPRTDFLFESGGAVENPTQEKRAKKKSTPKKRAAPAAEEKSEKKASGGKKPKTK
ncbi:hypothetical protein VE03_09892 [Pseudogymnoascus sp. 23342-1-I1]|nr:hypothetical protein VE03_09892 [Pseudogymnoascus sp. 23342-1-I1]